MGDRLRLTAGRVVVERGPAPSALWVSARLLGDLDVVVASIDPEAEGTVRTRPIPLEALPGIIDIDIDGCARGAYTVALVFSGVDLTPRIWETRVEPAGSRWSATVPFTLHTAGLPVG